MNNRQTGRRRGRGGQRSQGNPQGGSRIDNRARGNASQLHEKYKTLARDAQMQGDRVNTEYYLQFADHYFRVLNENRSRVEEHQRRQREDADDDDDNDDIEERGEEQQRGRARDRNDGEPRQNRRETRNRDDGNRDDGDRADDSRRNSRSDDNQDEPSDEAAAPRRTRRVQPRPADDEQVTGDEGSASEEAPQPKRGRGRPRREAAAAEGEPAAIEADRLPPSLSTSGDDGEQKPRRRRGRPPADAAVAAE